MVEKSLDRKLRNIHADPRGCKDFILADAKDADMALAIGAPGRSPEAHSGELRYCSLAEFRVPNLDDPDYCASYTTITARRVYAGARAVIFEDVAAPLAGTVAREARAGAGPIGARDRDAAAARRTARSRRRGIAHLVTGEAAGVVARAHRARRPRPRTSPGRAPAAGSSRAGGRSGAPAARRRTPSARIHGFRW